jgi:DNA-binding PadR family transcriptional regulator
MHLLPSVTYRRCQITGTAKQKRESPVESPLKSRNNRKAKFYAITRAGRRQLAKEAENWQRIAGVIARLLRTTEQS